MKCRVLPLPQAPQSGTLVEETRDVVWRGVARGELPGIEVPPFWTGPSDFRWLTTRRANCTRRAN